MNDKINTKDKNRNVEKLKKDKRNSIAAIAYKFKRMA